MLTLCLRLSACLYACVLIHRLQGVVGKGVTLTHSVSHCPGEKVFIKQQPGSNTHLKRGNNRGDIVVAAR